MLTALAPAEPEFAQPTPDQRKPHESDSRLRQQGQDQQQSGHREEDRGDRPVETREPPEVAAENVHGSEVRCRQGEGLVGPRACARSRAWSGGRSR